MEEKSKRNESKKPTFKIYIESSRSIVNKFLKIQKKLAQEKDKTK